MSTGSSVEEIGNVVGVCPDVRPRGWLERVVDRRMNRALAKARAKREAGAYAGVAPEERARSVVRWACAKAAVTGMLSGAASTGAVVATAETEGLAGIVAIPFAALAVGGEMALRAVLHVDLACELAEIFELKLDEEVDVLRLLALGRASGGESDRDDIGQSLLESASLDSDAMTTRAARVILGESVLKNLVPFASIVSSAVTNVVMTRRVGRTMRRCFRYERAMVSAIQEAERACANCIDLLIEGLWFVFIADGRLSLEETACLTMRLDGLEEERRRRLLLRFTADESDWLERLRSVPDGGRDAFFHVLEVAAALDKSLALPEQRLLSRAADVLKHPFDPARVRQMIEQLEQTGVFA